MHSPQTHTCTRLANSYLQVVNPDLPGLPVWSWFLFLQSIWARCPSCHSNDSREAPKKSKVQQQPL